VHTPSIGFRTSDFAPCSFFLLPDNDPRRKSLLCTVQSAALLATVRHLSSQPSLPRPCRPARRACLIDIDTWRSLDWFRFVQTKALIPIHPLFPGRHSSAAAGSKHPPRAQSPFRFR
jgi:hypothetical protein